MVRKEDSLCRLITNPFSFLALAAGTARKARRNLQQPSC
jgi:hypothetical protein